ncbi:MAG: hypothetical protein HC881_13870 [Leptolyngbyaceae cyanobacterium SL_7_1]|nr:hypothetical protein [Leptolyngbyaceae cyanobacterium SL_7_1]
MTPPNQFTKLTNELEFTRQKDKRQQILLETLKGQLETSQERVAQLERECTLTQQRYNEQLQLLNQRENDCRDLRSRLQRQQRYTLQFKAALEKCLEVPPPNYDSAAEAIDRAMVQIPTWYQADQLSPMLLPKGQTIQPWSSQSQSRFLDKLHLSSLTDEPNLQPLPDSLVEPVASDRQTPDSAPTPIAPVIDLASIRSTEPPEVSPEVIQAGLEELQLAVNDLWKDAIAPPINPATNPPSDDGEAALWQDLARLIDVSADDVVRASLAGDFSLFESIDLQNAVLPTEDASDDIPGRTQVASNVTEAAETRSPSIPFENPNSPSPLVHPLRQLKKITSFAAIDLPNFAR